jgi:hypothetical protein
MNTEMNTSHGQQEPSQSSPQQSPPKSTGEDVTTSSGISFSLPSWAEKDSPARQPADSQQAVPMAPFVVQYF